MDTLYILYVYILYVLYIHCYMVSLYTKKQMIFIKDIVQDFETKFDTLTYESDRPLLK